MLYTSNKQLEIEVDKKKNAPSTAPPKLVKYIGARFVWWKLQNDERNQKQPEQMERYTMFMDWRTLSW